MSFLNGLFGGDEPADIGGLEFEVLPEELKQIGGRGRQAILVPCAAAINKHAGNPRYDLTTGLRLSHFCGQAVQECDGFMTLEEYASGAGYEGRRDLGNVQRGDGKRYKGRGIFQLTGRDNYERIGGILGVDLINHPERAAEAELSVLIAFEYWRSRKMNVLADKDDCLAVSIAINGKNRKTGMPNHYKERLAYTNRAKVIFEV